MSRPIARVRAVVLCPVRAVCARPRPARAGGASFACTRTVLFAAVAAASAASIPAQQVDTLDLRAHTFFLAADLLAGRGTGSPGEHIAAEYIESQLRLIGLAGLMPDGAYRQPVPLRALTVAPTTSLTLSTAAGTRYASGRDFIVGAGGAGGLRGFEGRAVFVGDAVQAPPSGPALRGSVVVVYGTLGGAAATLLPAWERAGVVGVVQLVPDSAGFDLLARSRGGQRLYVDAAVDDPIWQPSLPSVVAGPALSAALLAGVRLPPEALAGQPFPPIRLTPTLAVSIEGEHRPVHATNVGAILPGSDAALRNELVVYTAHYDHLGIVPAAGGDSIYNGFSDNAAGVAMLLAIARALAANPPARSVAFLFLTGEERGLLGASFFAAEPPAPLDRIAAVINLDAGAPPAPPVSWRIAGGTGSPLGALAADIAAGQGWTTQLSDASPNSDYWPFLRRGVPAIFLIPGADWENITPQQRDSLRQRWDRYHHPDDEWAPDFPFAGLERYATFALLVGRAVADRR
jgi:Peptidase family M28